MSQEPTEGKGAGSQGHLMQDFLDLDTLVEQAKQAAGAIPCNGQRKSKKMKAKERLEALGYDQEGANSQQEAGRAE